MRLLSRLENSWCAFLINSKYVQHSKKNKSQSDQVLTVKIRGSKPIYFYAFIKR